MTSINKKTMAPNEYDYRSIEEWIYRDVPKKFWMKTGEVLTDEEFVQRFEEIPTEVKSIAYLTIQCFKELADERKEKEDFNTNCSIARMYLYYSFMETIGEVPLPHYRDRNGVMIEPEKIVKLTNGIVGWEQDESCENCSRKGPCRFYTEEKK